jgi:restriction system protein
MRAFASGCFTVLLFALTGGLLLRWGGVGGTVSAAAVGVLALGRLYGALREARLRHTLAELGTMDGQEFEAFVGQLLAARGFTVEPTGGAGDLGVDLVARSRDVCYAVQVKRYATPVSRRAVSDAVAGADHYDCDAAMVVTNSQFTRGALLLAESTGCELVDGELLMEWVSRAGRRLRAPR